MGSSRVQPMAVKMAFSTSPLAPPDFPVHPKACSPTFRSTPTPLKYKCNFVHVNPENPVPIPNDKTQALVSFKKYMPPPLPYFKVNIYPFPLPHFASIFSLICDPFTDPIISLHSRDISFFDCHI